MNYDNIISDLINHYEKHDTKIIVYLYDGRRYQLLNNQKNEYFLNKKMLLQTKAILDIVKNEDNIKKRGKLIKESIDVSDECRQDYFTATKRLKIVYKSLGRKKP